MYLLSHFLNEEFLLPYWIRHHLGMFDKAILIDYGSTDRSVEIIRELAPHWEIRKTNVKKFEEPAIGEEIQEIEMAMPAGEWKVVLNTTEFLLVDDLKVFIARFEEEFPQLPGFRATGVIMIDSVEEQFQPLTQENILLQRHHGCLERAGEMNIVTSSMAPSRCRFVHKLPCGGYCNGRHTTMFQVGLRAIDRKYGSKQNLDIREWKDAPESEWMQNAWYGIHPEIYVCWFGRYSPFEAIKKRAAFLDYTVPRPSFLNQQPPANPDDTSYLDVELKFARKRAYDLCQFVPTYRKYVDHLGS